jgi:hypothetical protein
MPSPADKLAQSLEVLHDIQADKRFAIQSSDLARVHRERLVKGGFLQEVMKGWYMPTNPDMAMGASAAWYSSYWLFCASYLQTRFGDDWCLSPEQSLNLHVGNRTVPAQLLVRSTKGRNNLTLLPYSTSILDIQSRLPQEVELQDGLAIYSLPAALIACSLNYFRNHQIDARAALTKISDASVLLRLLLEGGNSVIAGRLAGAFRNVGRDRIADDILEAMKSESFDCREEDPFVNGSPILFRNSENSAYANRIRLIWQEMREPVLKSFPASPSERPRSSDYLKQIQELYTTDAYHSLSIEGYQVSRELIEKIRLGNWNPDKNNTDRELRNALAMRGYWQSYQAVRYSVQKVLDGKNAGSVVDDDHGTWYRELFSGSVSAGLLKPADLAGYRSDQVFIGQSMHVPPSPQAMREMMPTLFDLLKEETDAGVRAVLGHFIFVYIHPYMDGNGRIGRFLMNVMLASGGYPWTVIPVERRKDYLEALECASVGQDIAPLSKFLAGLVKKAITGKPEAK